MKTLSACFAHISRHAGRSSERIVLFTMIILYTPFMAQPVLRTTGDEKVYIAQAWEMADRSSWFLQTLANQANYYKGPLHLLLVRLGFLIFGKHNLWAILWMNWVFLGLCCFLVTRWLRKLWPKSQASLTFGLGLIFAPGIFAHMFASQMEIELVCIYTLIVGLMLKLQRQPHRKGIWLTLWLLAGLAAWLKSPLHSVLLGTSILGYGLWDKNWRMNLVFKKSGMIVIVVAIILASLAYVIPWYLDGQAFYRTYILRETITKGPNGVGIFSSIIPNISYHFWPLAPMLCFGLAVWIKECRTYSFQAERLLLPGLSIALAVALPTFIFFAWHPYRSQIYCLPVVPAILIITVILWEKAQTSYPKIARWVQLFTLSGSLFPSILILVLNARFHPNLIGWSEFFTHSTLVILVFQVMSLTILTLKSGPLPLGPLCLLLWLPGFFSTSKLMTIIGIDDIKGLKDIAQSLPSDQIFGFYNADRYVWSEWALLNFTSGLSIQGLHTERDVKEWITKGQSLIVLDEKQLQIIRESLPDTNFRVESWIRWKSHGLHSKYKNPLTAWIDKDLRYLQGPHYVLIPTIQSPTLTK